MDPKALLFPHSPGLAKLRWNLAKMIAAWIPPEAES